MKLTLSAILIALFTFSIYAQPVQNDWENPQMFNLNKEKAHATLMPFSTVNEALTQKPQQSVFYKSLNGTWKFNWVRKPADRPKDF
ncbi:MAG: hypothetical protein R3182_02205, partial [Draconibacterium sp.]|nr:hypothetical protein [Draconibacterium sp.]